MRKIALTFEEIIIYSKYALKIEERRRRGGRTNIYVKYLRPNIVLYYDINDSLSEIKARIINEDVNLTLDILLVINILLTIDSSRYKFKNKLIPVIRRNSKKIIYVNNNSSPRVFIKPVVDYIFKINYNY